MKNSLVNYIIAIAVAILAVELFNIGTYLMNQPDSILFYIGLTLIGSEVFLIGWFIIKELNKIFTKDEKIDGDKE